MGKLKAGILVSVGFLTSVSAGMAASVGSVYTRHDYAACKKASSDGVVETRVCAGYDGIVVRWIGEPDGDAVEFGSTRGSDGLGVSFSFVGKTVEWRGPVRGVRIAPAAAIVRVEVMQSIGGPVHRRLLVVHKLDGNRGSCIAAVVNAGTPDGNARARKVADEVVPGFRCGVDRRQSIGL